MLSAIRKNSSFGKKKGIKLKIKLNTILGPLTLIILVGVYFFTSKEGTEEKQSSLPKPSSVKEIKISQSPAERTSQETPLEKGPQKKTEGEEEKKASPLAWDKAYEELLDISGVEKQVRNFDELLKRQLDMDINEQDGQPWKKIMAKNFKSKFILDEIRKEFQNVPSEELDRMLKSFDDPLMKKISKLEEMATMSDSQDQFDEFARDFDKIPDDPEREKLIKEIDKYSGSTENTVNMVMAMMKGAQIGQNLELPVNERVEDKEIEEAMLEIRPQIKEMMANSMHKTQQFALKGVPNHELGEYSQQLQDSNVKSFQDRIGKAITRSFSKMGENLGKDMAKYAVKEEKSEKEP